MHGRIVAHHLHPTIVTKPRTRYFWQVVQWRVTCCEVEDNSYVEMVQEVELEWEGITCILDTRVTTVDEHGKKCKQRVKKTLLDSVYGAAQPKNLLAIVGPSGSGKTTLLNVLSQRLPYSSRLQLYGQLRANGASAVLAKPRSAFVSQGLA